MKTLTLPIRPHENQRMIVKSPHRFNVYPAGRRFGKTEAQKLRCIYKILQGQVVWWVNPTFDNGTDAWLDFMNFFQQFLPSDSINKSSRRIFLPNGGQLRMIGANNFKRGSGINHVAVDEAAFCNLSELWQYQLRPMLLESKGSADFFSSTNGRNGFWQLWTLATDPTEPDWHGQTFTTYDNPLLDPAEINDIKRSTPERVFKQEYMAEFLDDGGAVFRNLNACIYGSATNESAHNPVVIGVDWGKSNDYTVLTVIDTVAKKVLEIDRFNQIDWILQRGRLAALCARYNVSVIYAESNSIGEPNIEALQQDGLPVRGFYTSSVTKSEIINSLALAFEQETIHIPDDPALLNELQAYTLERLPSGNFRYNAPSGLHDDMVISLALAWHGVARPMVARTIDIPDIFGHYT